MKSDEFVPAWVPLLYPGKSHERGEEVYESWRRVRENLVGFEGYRTPFTHLRCAFCEASFQLLHQPEHAAPIPVVPDGGLLKAECAECRAKRDGGAA